MDRAANAVGRASRWAVRDGLVLGLIAVQPAHAQDFASRVVELDRLPKARPDIPVASDPNMLFYVQRSTNPNTVVYAARLDMAQPVEVFWRRFKSDGARVPLSFTERNVAYGVDVRRIEGRDDAVLANIVSYPDRKAVIEAGAAMKPRAVLQIGNRRARLVYAYIDVDDSGTVPKVKSVDIYGTDLSTGKALHEKLTRR